MSATLTLPPSMAAAVTAYRAAKALREEAGRAVRPVIHDGRFEGCFEGSSAYVMACQAEDSYAQQLAALVAETDADRATRRHRLDCAFWFCVGWAVSALLWRMFP